MEDRWLQHLDFRGSAPASNFSLNVDDARVIPGGSCLSKNGAGSFLLKGSFDGVGGLMLHRNLLSQLLRNTRYVKLCSFGTFGYFDQSFLRFIDFRQHLSALQTTDVVLEDATHLRLPQQNYYHGISLAPAGI